MRSGVCWGAVVLLVAITVLRSTQVEGASRISRRQPTSTVPSIVEKAQEVQPKFRRRDSKKEPEEIREPSRNRIRSRSSTTETTPVTPDKPQIKSARSEQINSRRPSSRSRSRLPVHTENLDTATKENNSITSTTQNLINRFNQKISSTTPTGRGLNKYESISSTLETLQDNNVTSDHIKSRTTVRTSQNSLRTRGRNSAQNDKKALDLEVSGTMNTITVIKPTTARSDNSRNSKRLRFKTRFSEIETNLTGNGFNSTDSQSSHVHVGITSQPHTKSLSSPTATNNDDTENQGKLPSTVRSVRLVKRPSKGVSSIEYITQGKTSKVSDEISDDDNYPASFKALIQAKNASTDTSSPSESLAVKASQKVFETFTPTSQTNNTGSDSENWRLRDKSKIEHIATEGINSFNNSKFEEVSIVYAQHNRINENSSSDTTTLNPSLSNSSSTFKRPNRRPYKSSRNLKITTEVSTSSKGKNENSLRKPLRSSFYPKTKFENTVSTEAQLMTDDKYNNNIKSSISSKPMPTLLRTSYYSRTLKNTKNITSTERNISKVGKETLLANKKNENVADMPIIFTNLSGRSKMYLNIDSDEHNMTDKPQKPFIIKVNSKESSENSTEINSNNFNDKVSILSENLTSTQKYHATYKDFKRNSSLDNSITTIVPPIKNIQSRKYSRQNSKIYKNEDVITISSRNKEKSLRKYSDSYSKTSESSSNGIVVEPEKSKNKFSSKYRASYLDKPYYKPTVPTITSSTAWLKFYVTDSLVKSLEEPKWFEEEDFIGSTTETISRPLLPSQLSPETPINMVEGEEIQLSPEINAISFTKPRSPLTSADLRLSDSFMKPSQVMNVEASNHSPSVTVSIFDALADILTSTPKSIISSTIGTQKSQIISGDVNETLDGVSSNNNVNIVKGFTNQNTLISTDILDTTANFVQTTDGATPNVSNRLTIQENMLPIRSSPLPTTLPPIILPITPISQRKPFAIKVLYSESRPTIDKLTAVPTSTIDSSTMVYHTISDLLLSNNKFVSLELTSMLVNNIENIIHNMDDSTKAKLSKDMVKLLNTLVPRAFNRRKTKIEDEELLFNTTPYSLEDLKDTENIYVDKVIDNINNVEQTLDDTITSTVNTMSASEVENVADSNKELQLTSEIITPRVSVNNLNTFKSTSDAEYLNVSTTTTVDNNTNVPVPSPFITNYQPGFLPDNSDSGDNIVNDLTSPPPPSSSSVLKSIELQNIESIQDPSQLSRLQLWVLSKKARVLKMIEDIIKEHNDEIATSSLTELFNKSNNNSFPNRLTEIMTSIVSTTRTLDFRNELTDTSFISSTFPTPPLFINTPNSSPSSYNAITTIFPESDTITTTKLLSETSTTSEKLFDRSFTTILPPNQAEATIDTPIETSTTLNSETIESVTYGLNTETPKENGFNEAELSTLAPITIASLFMDGDSQEKSTLDMNNDLVPTNTKTTTILTTHTENTIDPVATTSTNIENEELPMTPVTLKNIDSAIDLSTIIDNDIETTTTSPSETTMSMVINKTTVLTTPYSNLLSNISSMPQIPKKDYVIFGILPNNTVVRKNPNDDILETLTEASPYIIYGVLPNNTVIRKFPNGTRVPRIMQKIDVLPISPWSLRNPYSPIHNIPAIVRPQSNPIQESTNKVTFQDTSNNGSKNRLTSDTVNNFQVTMSPSIFNVNDSSSLGITSTTIIMPTEKSTASHVLNLRTTTMQPSVDEILLNSISSATKEEMVSSSMTSSTHEPRILTLDIDPETKQIRTEKPISENGNTIFKFIPIDEVTVTSQDSNVLKLASTKSSNSPSKNTQTVTMTVIPETTQIPQVQIDMYKNDESTTTIAPTVGTPLEKIEQVTVEFPSPVTNDDLKTTRSSNFDNIETTTTLSSPTKDFITTTINSAVFGMQTSTKGSVVTEITSSTPDTINSYITEELKLQTTTNIPVITTSFSSMASDLEDNTYMNQNDNKLLQNILNEIGRNPKSLSFDSVKQPPFNKMEQIDNNKLLQTLLNHAEKPYKGIEQNNPVTVRSIEDDIKQFEEDSKLLKALLLAMGRDPAELNLPSLDFIKTKMSETTAAVSTTPTISLKTTTLPILPTTVTFPITEIPIKTSTLSTTKTETTLPQQSSTEKIGISTTLQPFNERFTTVPSILTTSQTVPQRYQNLRSTTEIPSTSTYSDQEDLAFLQNLKSVLGSKSSEEDSEITLANRVIALAVERSLNEIQGTSTTTIKTTTPQTTTTTVRPSTSSINDDLRQFEEDTKLLQVLLKATGQDPSKLNIPSLHNINISPSISPTNSGDSVVPTRNVPLTSVKPYGAKIAVKDNLKNDQDDEKLLQTLIKLQGVQETTTQRSKLAITGQSSDEALKNLIKQAQPTGMVSEATKSSISLSTEYGNSNDALLAALLKEQGFGPTTASSLDEQIRLAALLNQVVVTPKAPRRRTTTQPPPPPAPRRPVLDGLAWLWQQWTETAPGTGAPRPNRGPAGLGRPAATQSAATSSRVNWFGSGPFTGNANDRPQQSNRIPLDPPSAVAPQGPGRGQLVSAAINVTRAFSQFLGAALQGAAQTVQNVIQAGQRAGSNAYTGGSG